MSTPLGQVQAIVMGHPRTAIGWCYLEVAELLVRSRPLLPLPRNGRM